MANFNLSVDMNLPIPIVGVDPGPDWALNVNSCLTILDAHDHTSGNGVQIKPSGLNINSDLTIQSNNLIQVKTVNFTAQTAALSGPSDVGCVYVSGVDLYYNDELGNQVQITKNGGLNGTPGSISGLSSPASASYDSIGSTFIWQSAVNTPANLDAASIVLRNFVANSKGLTLSPPNSMGSDYSIVLPQLPASQSLVTIDAAGSMGTSLISALADNVTISTSSNKFYVLNGDREHAFELNGIYSGLSYPLNNIDSIFFAPYNITITSVWIYNGTAGTGGTTEFDLKVASSGGAFSSILTTTGKITSAAASGVWTDSGTVIGAQTGVTKPVLNTTAITAGQAIRWDLITSMSGSPADARIRIYYKQS